MLWSENAMGGVLAPPIRLSLATDTPVGGTDAVNRAVDFYRPPQLSLMVGYIKDPEHSKFSLRQFAETVGKNFDARALATRAKKQVLSTSFGMTSGSMAWCIIRPKPPLL
jgi:hypothetical protein